jgi:2-polyprenyl-3-methyl-5-hydroxy-6-metoxy-1,4-benzoquinol methylase
MDDYIKFNRELTAKLVADNKGKGLPEGTFKRHQKIAKIVAQWADKSKDLLEVGVREGFLFDHLYSFGFKSLYGIDISPDAIKRLHERGWKGEINDVQCLTIEKTYGTIVMSHCLEHCPNPAKVIDNIYNVMDEDGILYVEVPEQPKEPVPTPWAHYYCFSSWEEFVGFFSKDKWKLMFSEVRNKNLKGVFKKCTYIDM